MGRSDRPDREIVMNGLRIGILILAVAAAGGAAFLARGTMGGGDDQPVQVVEVEKVRVLTASRDIAAGEPVTEASLRWQEWPKDAVAPAFLTADERDAVDGFLGALARGPISAGEPITAAKLLIKGEAGVMAALLSPGMRAIAVEIEAETAAGGFIMPNDRVDVILTRETRRGDGPREDLTPEAVTILADVRVLAIDQTYKEEPDDAAIVGDTATLEVTPEQAEIVALARAVGRVSLTLRALDQVPQGSGFGPRQTGLPVEPRSVGQTGARIRIVRAGRSSYVTGGSR
jgi:pilus assembly protein CpaB